MVSIEIAGSLAVAGGIAIAGIAGDKSPEKLLPAARKPLDEYSHSSRRSLGIAIAGGIVVAGIVDTGRLV